MHMISSVTITKGLTMDYLIYFGTFNIIASLGFVACSEMRSNSAKVSKTPRGVSQGQLIFASGVVSFSNCDEV